MLEGRVHDRFDQYAGEARISAPSWCGSARRPASRSCSATSIPDDLGHLHDAEADGRGGGGQGGRHRRPSADRRPFAGTGGAAAGGRHVRPDVAAARPRSATTSSRCSSTPRPAPRSAATALIQRQSAVGTGRASSATRRSSSTRQASGVFLTDDALRPPSLLTYDLQGEHRPHARILGRRHPALAVGRRHRQPTTSGPTAPPSTPTPTPATPTTTTSSASAGAASTTTTARSAPRPSGAARRSAPPRTTSFGTFFLNAFWCGDCGAAGSTWCSARAAAGFHRSTARAWNYFSGRASTSSRTS